MLNIVKQLKTAHKPEFLAATWSWCLRRPGEAGVPDPGGLCSTS